MWTTEKRTNTWNGPKTGRALTFKEQWSLIETAQATKDCEMPECLPLNTTGMHAFYVPFSLYLLLSMLVTFSLREIPCSIKSNNDWQLFYLIYFSPSAFTSFEETHIWQWQQLMVIKAYIIKKNMCIKSILTWTTI